MKTSKTRVFLTGATGVMGMSGLKELIKYPDLYDITVLARQSKINHKKLNPFISRGVRVIWGDLLDEKSIENGVKDSDIVLHVGGMVSPAAEHFPDKTLKVNIGSMKLIVDCVKKIEDNDPERIIKVVYIGSVSQYGSKLPPNHWGRVGDSLKAAKFDAYALSKILAERTLLEAGLRKWVSIRQTAILHSGLLKKANDPVTFHVPLRGAIEWVSVEDSGRLLERICRKDVPDSFWQRCYNVGGGEKFRLTNLEFERGILKALGCPSPEKIFEPNWFATDNFHGIWFEDSETLDEILHYRHEDSFEAALIRMKSELPLYYRLTPLVPAFLVKLFMKRVAKSSELGTLWWIKNNVTKRIEAAWGSLEKYEKIEDWSRIKEEILHRKKGFYTEKEIPESVGSYETRNVKCEKGHVYITSGLLERAGHSCPHCLRESTYL